jgi:hypothetical protein
MRIRTSLLVGALLAVLSLNSWGGLPNALQGNSAVDRAATPPSLEQATQPPTQPAATVSATAPDSVPAEPFELKWGRLQIHSLPESAVSAIKALPAMRRTKVSVEKECSQADFCRLAEIEGIESLAIHNNQFIDSLAPLAPLTSLKKLELYRLERPDDSPIDIRPLVTLVNLEDLECCATKLSHTEALASLIKLKRVKLYMSAVDSLEFLRSTPLVEELNLYGYAHTFKDYAPLLSLPGLKVLNIYMNKTATDALLAPLTALEKLEEISMSNSKEITSLDFLHGSRDLREVKASRCSKLVDISALADKQSLQMVDIEDSTVTDFSPLRNKPELQSLDVSGTAFADLSLLAASTKLQSLELQETALQDFSLLSTFPKLCRLTISKSIPESEVAALQTALPEVRIRQR